MDGMSIKDDLTDLFKQNKYVYVKNFISKELATFLYRYSLLKEKSVHTMIDAGLLNPTNILGTTVELQVPESFGSYGDFAMETMLDDCTNKIEKITNLDLIPTNSFFRIYRYGNELKKHKDRPSCEISATVCLGYDYTKPDEVYGYKDETEDYKWGMFVDGEEVFTDVGDAIIYRGCDVEHWRTVFEGTNQSQVFLHYNDLKGSFGGKNLYDGRPHLGLPNDFSKSN